MNLVLAFLSQFIKMRLQFNERKRAWCIEKRFEVAFRGRKIGVYIADLIVNEKVIIELKCCEQIHNEHQAQVINYLKASGILVGLLVNFGKRKLEYKRLHHPVYPAACDPAYPVLT